ncbi:MAG TPA: CatB-related O-acetyltransferase [Kineosporiaceae bacterium]|nr:CatB-related O-acetyltransferase [Kineosporiaceae bacterium]
MKRLLVRWYRNRHLRSLVLKVVRRLEGGEMHSQTLREIWRVYWGVDVGLYSDGACFSPWVIDPWTTIGRYTSIAHGVRILNHNHPLSFRGTHGVFFNPDLGFCDRWLVGFTPLEIGSDVWIGAGATVLPEVRSIGHGAVIGAGAVVTRDVPPYAVVLGNPARVVKYRFSPEVIEQLLAEKWWEKSLEELAAEGIQRFQTPLEGGDGWQAALGRPPIGRMYTKYVVSEADEGPGSAGTPSS